MTMRRGPSGPRPRSRDGRPRYAARRRVCSFCVDKIAQVDYKDVGRLRRFLSPHTKIEPRRRTGTCAKHQRLLSIALKRARQLALLPVSVRHITGEQERQPRP